MPKVTRSAVTTLLISLAMLTMDSYSKPLSSPLRVRFNSELMKDIFYKKDQEILNIFANISLGEFDLKDGNLIKDVRVNIIPQNEKLEDFNCHLSLDEKKFLGLEANELKFKGIGEIVHGEGESKTTE